MDSLITGAHALTLTPLINSGLYYQLPILLTALSVALGYELEDNEINGYYDDEVPYKEQHSCHYQVYRPCGDVSHPKGRLEYYIEDNMEHVKGMYQALRSGAPFEDENPSGGDYYLGKIVQSYTSPPPPPPPPFNEGNSTNRVVLYESEMKALKPCWALNSARQERAIVNTMNFVQTVYFNLEVCSSRCSTIISDYAVECHCEQKYKWHRLLAYIPEDFNGIFMDWFVFPLGCSCRCIASLL